MGFFKHVFRKESNDVNVVPPPMPTNSRPLGGDLSDIPPAPKPMGMDLPDAPETLAPGEFSDPDTDFSIPPLDSSFSDNPMSDSPFMQDDEQNADFDPLMDEDNSSFAEKFGTHPDPEIQTEVHEAHQNLQSDTSDHEDLQPHEQFSFSGQPSSNNPTMDILDQIQPREQHGDKQISPNELPLHEQLDSMIDEHVEERMQSNIPSEHEEMPMPPPPPTFTPIQVQEKPVQIPLSRNVDPNKPLFVRREFCGELVGELSDVRSVLKDREDDYVSFQNLEKQLDTTYDNWKGSLEAIQSNLIKIDKMIFKD